MPRSYLSQVLCTLIQYVYSVFIEESRGRGDSRCTSMARNFYRTQLLSDDTASK